MKSALQPATDGRPRTRHTSWVGCWVALLYFALAGVAQPAGEVASSDVEAAYLYNFGKFVVWPAPTEPASQTFNICLLGRDEFGKTFDAMVADELVQGRSIAVKRPVSSAGVDACNILYIGRSEGSRLARDLENVKDRPILTVSALPGFLDHGGMIQFLERENKVRFAVNVTAATRARLALSSELLKVAVYVNSAPAGGDRP